MRRDTPEPTLKPPSEHCCAELRYYVEHGDRIVLWWPPVREYLIPVRDGGSSGIVLRFCPWCGRRLPASARSEG